MPATKRPNQRESGVQRHATAGNPGPEERFERGRRHLLRRDPRLAVVIRQTGSLRPSFTPRDPFESLTTAVISQQLSTKAAATIRSRVAALMPALTPIGLLAIPVAELRSAGLSGQKTAYLRDLALRVQDDRLDLERLTTLSDEDVIDALVTVKGIGRWTAQMFLMFSLHRPDVLPTGDLGIVKGFQRVLGTKTRPSIRTMERVSEGWRPYRSIGCWYLWRTLE